MMFFRLMHWTFRIKTLPVIDPETGRYIPGTMRVPTLYEAITGISGT